MGEVSVTAEQRARKAIDREAKFDRCASLALYARGLAAELNRIGRVEGDSDGARDAAARELVGLLHVLKAKL